MRRLGGSWVLTCTVAAALLGACRAESDFEDDAAQTAPADAQGAAQPVTPATVAHEVQVTLTDDSIAVAEPSVSAGAITFVVQNHGTMPQVVRVRGPELDLHTDPIAPHAAAVRVSAALGAGRYELAVLGDTAQAAPVLRSAEVTVR